MKIFIIYLLIVNIIAFILMGADKNRARRHEWRIPERALFLSAIVGGSIGAIVSMGIFRHKTKHVSFVVGMPAILVAQLILLMQVLKVVRG